MRMRTKAMRVLVLAPPRTSPEAITEFSFLDEEVQGLARAGVEPYVLAPDLERGEMMGPVRLLPLSRDDVWRQRLESVALISRNRARVPACLFRRPAALIHRARVEGFVARTVKAHDIDVIHDHFGPFLGFGGALAHAETGVPLVATFRGMDLLVDRALDYGLSVDPMYAAACRNLLQTADITTYASDFMREEGIRSGADPSRALTIRKGVDLERFQVAPHRTALRAELGVDGPMILTVAGLIRRKGIDTILRALASLGDAHDVTLVVCGKGPERGRLEELAGDLGIRDRVLFRGYVPREAIPSYFAACDIFVLASRIEAAGNVILEAMAAGRPVITTDSGGPPEYVRDQQTGYVVPVDAHDALAEKLRLLLGNPELQDRLGAAGRTLAGAEHGYGRLIRDFISAYGAAGAGMAGHMAPTPLPLERRA